ncbi:hypothetical protein ES288_A01G174200v1 [Gossypium darwinii]|uniref:Transmembrane protein n=1 Tax=Gossypium darwinii TaxID=34276 RepID=A0A5D2HNG4_GOSDA|nr:hypothetical protein ES288_A01G174200v1 [Gossypium darwinii]
METLRKCGTMDVALCTTMERSLAGNCARPLLGFQFLNQNLSRLGLFLGLGRVSVGFWVYLIGFKIWAKIIWVLINYWVFVFMDCEQFLNCILFFIWLIYLL